MTDLQSRKAPALQPGAAQAPRIGQRIEAATWPDVFPTVAPAYAGPWEDIKLKP